MLTSEETFEFSTKVFNAILVAILLLQYYDNATTFNAINIKISFLMLFIILIN